MGKQGVEEEEKEPSSSEPIVLGGSSSSSPGATLLGPLLIYKTTAVAKGRSRVAVKMTNCVVHCL